MTWRWWMMTKFRKTSSLYELLNREMCLIRIYRTSPNAFIGCPGVIR